METSEEYLARCSIALKDAFGVDRIRVKITDKSVNMQAWFNDLIGQEVDIYGVDYQSLPKRYLTKDGDAIPFPCAEVIRRFE